jgi:acyl-homoserine lactone acylase PvdQ
MRALRIIGRIVAILCVLVLLLLIGVAGTLYLTLPGDHEQASIPGLDAAVNVTFDTDGIPRIQA